MNSGYPSEEDVITDLGDKVVAGIAHAVAQMRDDLRVYRNTFPGWVGASTDRGLLSWCHDRAWAHLTSTFDDVVEVDVVDRPPLREMFVGTRYRLRFKKHDVEDRVTTYPTQTALAFLEQDSATLDGLEEVCLVAGYRWDPVLRQVGAGVISLRDGRENVIWTHVLAEPTTGIVEATPIVGATGPTAPRIDMPHRDTQTDRRSDGPEDT